MPDWFYIQCGVATLSTPDDIEHLYFPGFENKDVAFLHKPSKTLIQADLLFNLHSVKE